MWDGGGGDAKELLEESTGPDDPPLFSAAQLDFKAIAATGSDMLRPNGDGAYVGLKSARDEDENDDRGEQLPHTMLIITSANRSECTHRTPHRR